MADLAMKVLLLDIETSPNLAHVWGLFKQNVSLNQLVDSSYTMCWAAKWLGQRRVEFMSDHDDGGAEMIERIHTLIDESDAVVHYNGTKFDMPTLNKEFLLHGLGPPSPYHQIDLLKVARGQFRFPSNKLDYVAKALGLSGKVKHIGHDLWVQCMAGEAKAWRMMRRYNIQDVRLLEDVYHKLLPWIKHHPNHGLYQMDKGSPKCTNCGSSEIKKNGTRKTRTGRYQQFMCNDCGTWMRSRNLVKEDRSGVMVQA